MYIMCTFRTLCTHMTTRKRVSLKMSELSVRLLSLLFKQLSYYLILFSQHSTPAPSCLILAYDLKFAETIEF